ncbi:TonB-dependent receptor [Povalibacter sp.]|uniref:TonB-dependent receptor n=1 Tax=Povalibacter sp. TaxID=1962978 RepID=UPI0032C211FE
MILGTTVVFSTALTQETQVLEEVVVTGIRGSLISSMELKRSSQGVVDGIVAEDIGKFPDTNLAESLQRITGVAIDRTAIGEGSRITVRGVGPDYNLVLLNGRQMPASSIEATTVSNSRAFDFANIASEAISAIEVYKTSRSNTPTGGIGATVNVRTARPLDAPGLHSSLGVKGVFDTSADNLPSNLQGDTFTPEISGIYSNTFGDDKFGIAISGSYQERDLGYNQATTGGWRAFGGDEVNWGTIPLPGSPGSERITNRPDPTDTYSVPQSLGYSFNSVERKRTNGQLALQWAPTDNVTATLDYTYSENKIATARNELSAWFNFGASSSSWTDGPVAAPDVYTELLPDGTSDVGMGGAKYATKNENNSVGFNLKWDVSDRLGLQFDYHDSTAESGPDSPYGSNVAFGVSDLSRGDTTGIFSSDFPVLGIALRNGRTTIDPSRMEVTGSSFRNSYMKSEVQQGQLSGDFEFTDSSRLDFGVGLTEVNNRTAFSNVQSDNTWTGIRVTPAGQTVDWIPPAGTGLSRLDFDDDIWKADTIRGYFDQISGSGNPALFNQFFTFDFERLRSQVAQLRGALTDPLLATCPLNGNQSVRVPCYEASNVYGTDRRVEEKSKSAYIQFSQDWEWGRPMHAAIGLRYEETDVTSSALVPIPTGIVWGGNNEFNVQFGAPDFTTLEGSYDYLLPSFDFSVDITDNLKLRASYGESIGRPQWGDIQGGQTLDGLARINGGTGRQGDPSLKPLESQNIDLSMEWYYGEASYLSVGYFRKNIDNYIGVATVQLTPFELPHPANGAYYNEANTNGACNGDLGCIRSYIFTNHDGDPGVNAAAGTIMGLPGDPITVFDIQVPTNQKSAKLDGWELNVQHMFGQSGFGLAANYTKVDSNIGYDNYSRQDQFAMVGLSDSANLVAFYENYGFGIRAAYNWRDKFLSATFDSTGTPNPNYTEEYGQLDISASYDITSALTIQAEVINLTDEIQRIHGRHPNQLLFATQTGPRYMLGARYKFGQ